MAATVLKLEVETETCCICGAGGELMSPEEYDATNGTIQAPMRTMLLHLNNNKVVPEGRLCTACLTRAADAFEFSSALGARAAPPLGDKIRALRRRLHELTQKIDVFIVVGAPKAGGASNYSEDDIIMVERDALAAAAAADDHDTEHARNAKGDTVYQCSVCPLSFQRASEYLSHVSTHPAECVHSCWTCGAQFTSRHELRQHAAADHAATHLLDCNLCHASFATQWELRRHTESCTGSCPACGWRGETGSETPSGLVTRAAVSAHAAAAHGRGSAPPHVCPACFQIYNDTDLFSAHLLKHRQAKQFVCGYGDCVVRFASRAALLHHIRKAHTDTHTHSDDAAAAPPAAPPALHPCTECDRTFASSAAMKRHMHTHNRAQIRDQQLKQEVMEESMVIEGVGEGDANFEGEGEVEYLEVDTLDDVDLVM